MSKSKTSTKLSLDDAAFEKDYRATLPLANRLHTAVCEQLTSIISDNDLTLGVPLESRVKTWTSIQEKLQRTGMNPSAVCELQDLVGVRVIFLFKNELDDFQNLIRESFEIVSEEDTANRLQESQFGYQSRHIIIKLPEEWLRLPSLKGLDNLMAEIQVRTVAQHIWAAASHKLQYKREQSVPLPVRRSIHRVSALLETVDLEFLRVLDERKTYVESRAETDISDVALNVDSLRQIMDRLLPSENRDSDEPYDKMLSNLDDLGVRSTSELVKLIQEHLEKALLSDREEVKKKLKSKFYLGTSRERLEAGVFWTHVGLLRQILKAEFGEAAVDETIARHLDPRP